MASVPPEGVGAAIRGDLALLRARAGQTAGVVVAGLALVAIVASAYPRYWERPARGGSAGVAGTTPASPDASGAGSGATGGVSPGPLVVVEFSDYECPACARAHEEVKALLAGRPDVQLVRRHFPLDSECNPAVKRRMHPEACGLARVGVCAEAQGKLEPMEDALFKNQVANRPVEELARAVGLDLAKLRACLASPETDARIRADVEAGIRVGLRATPTFMVGGRQYAGQLPADALPPPRSTAAAN